MDQHLTLCTFSVKEKITCKCTEIIITYCNLKHHSLFSYDIILHATNIVMDDARNKKKKKKNLYSLFQL